MPDEIGLVMTPQGALRGFTQDDDRAWKRFKAWSKRLAAGEFFSFSYKQPRNAKFHRKFFALMKVGFDHWEPERGRKRLTYKGVPIEKDFDAFRRDITIMAGFFTATYDLEGRVKLEAKSISFAKMEQDTFERLYEAVVRVLLEQVLTNYHRDDLDRAVAQIERFAT